MITPGLDYDGVQVVFHSNGQICPSPRTLIESDSFIQVVGWYIDSLKHHDSLLLESLGISIITDEVIHNIITLLRTLADSSLEHAIKAIPGGKEYLARRKVLHEFVEGLYNFWRSFNRFLVCHSEPSPDSHDTRPYRTFNQTVEQLTHLVRSTYRDICENITGDHPRVYRQVSAGCEVGLIVVPKPWPVPAKSYDLLKEIPFIRQVWIAPPLIMDPSMNKRTGQFQKIAENPLNNLRLEPRKWFCYPAQVGPLVIFIYFHQRFIGLGCALANLFELARDDQIAKGPDAVYLYGIPPENLAQFGGLPTVFYDDEQTNLLVAAVPGEDRFGYFGYLKKMTLTLHNIVMMKRGRMPYHGAMVRIVLNDGTTANILLIGDTATGKSESLEAFRVLGKSHLQEMRIIADDMGSLKIRAGGKIVAYGTEIGAFIRLDDLQQGYAFGQIDRAIIMSPQKVNARVVLPVTTLEDVLHGYEVNYFLYANNYESVDDSHPVIERFDTVESALRVFREGAAMAKGTTTAIGLVHTYFANIFGPPQYRSLHEEIAKRIFTIAFNSGIFIGQVRTRLGIPGYETKGPQEVARALFELIGENKK